MIRLGRIHWPYQKKKKMQHYKFSLISNCWRFGCLLCKSCINLHYNSLYSAMSLKSREWSMSESGFSIREIKEKCLKKILATEINYSCQFTEVEKIIYIDSEIRQCSFYFLSICNWNGRDDQHHICIFSYKYEEI